jgi:signal transduction histidine kinase
MTTAARLAAAPIAVAAGAGAVALAEAHPAYSYAGSTTASAALELGAGWALAAAGLIVWPRRRAGAVLVAASIAWFALEAANPASGSALLFTVGLLVAGAWPAVLLHATVDDRLLVALGYVTTVGLFGVAVTLVDDAAAAGCSTCPRNLLHVADAPRATAVGRVALLAVAVWAVAAVVVIAWRLARAPRARRRLRAPVLIPVAAALACAGADALHGVGRGFVSNDATDRVLWAATAVALLAVAAGVLSEWVRAVAARRRIGLLSADLDALARVGLRDALAAALKDPTLDLVYAGDGGEWLQPDGSRTALPPGAVRLTAGGRAVAAIALADPSLLDQVADVARLGLEHERLQAELRAHLADLRASRARVVAAGDGERRRLERDLHDGAQQRLVSLALSLQLARRATGDPALDRAVEHLGAALADLRELARGIHPAVLEQSGLTAAVEALAEAVPRLRLGELPGERLAPAVESAAYHVVAEVLRLSRGPVRAGAWREGERLVLELEPAPEGRVVALEDRVGALDGRLVNGGRSLRVELPCAS